MGVAGLSITAVPKVGAKTGEHDVQEEFEKLLQRHGKVKDSSVNVYENGQPVFGNEQNVEELEVPINTEDISHGITMVSGLEFEDGAEKVIIHSSDKDGNIVINIDGETYRAEITEQNREEIERQIENAKARMKKKRKEARKKRFRNNEKPTEEVGKND